jgi:hypothetical protein
VDEVDETESDAVGILDGISLPNLSFRGELIKKVLVATMVGGVCQSDDWRGDFPRYLAEYLPLARFVYLYAREPLEDWKCSTCSPRGLHEVDGQSNCDFYMGDRLAGEAADLLLIIGSGDNSADMPPEQQWPQLRQLLQKGPINGNTLTIHVPIRTSASIGLLFNFHHYIHDQSYMKPLAKSSLRDMLSSCSAETKGKNLIYVGRYTEGKGQVAFLETVDPEMLKGYNVNFYGGSISPSKEYLNAMTSTAAKRGISITVHPPVSKSEVLQQYCRSSGQIHYALGDDNPRAVYEGISAGVPQFVTPETVLHDIVYRQPFVTSISFMDKGGFDKAFGAFMDNVRNVATFKQEMADFAKFDLNPDVVYRRLCVVVGICKPDRWTMSRERNGVIASE